jgi:hypothetical protein
MVVAVSLNREQAAHQISGVSKRSYVRRTSECNALTAASRFSAGTNRLTECGDNTYMSGTIP